MTPADLALRDAFAVAAYPSALACALRGWDHICDSVVERAAVMAYAAADEAMKHRAARTPNP